MVDEPPRNADPAEEAPVSQVQQGGTARVVLPRIPGCLNPYLPKCEGAEALIGTVLEAPLAVDPGPTYKPILVEQMPSYDAETLSLEPLTLEVRLREGLTFSDGEPLTSADVKWTYERAIELAEEGHIAPAYAGFGRVSRVEAPDERTVRVVFEEPYAHWRDLLTAPILPRHFYEGTDFAELGLIERAVGSGPFLLENFGEQINFAENQDYWTEEPLPNLESMEITTSSTKEAAARLSKGQADFGFFSTTRTLPDSGDLLRAAAAPVRIETLLFNSRKLDAETREAVARAVDRGRMADDLGASVARSFVPPEFVPGYYPAWTSSPDDQPSGQVERPLKLVYAKGSRTAIRDQIAGNIVEDLSNAGIEANMEPLPSSKPLDQVLSDGNFDLALLAPEAPAGYETLALSLPPDSRDALAESLGTIDANARSQALHQAQEQMFADTALLPLFVWPDTMAWSSNLTGPRPDTPYSGLMSNARDWAFYK